MRANKEEFLPTIGYASLDLNKFIKWYTSDEAFEWVNGKWSNHFYHLQGTSGLNVSRIYDDLCGCTYNLEDSRIKPDEDYMENLKYKFKCARDRYISWLEKRLQYIETFELFQKIPVVWKDKEMYVIQFGDTQAAIPKVSESLIFYPLKDYSGIEYNNIKNIRKLNGDIQEVNENGLIEQDISVQKMNTYMERAKQFEEQFAQNLQDIKDGKTEELEALQKEVEEKMAELNKRKEALMAELNAKKEQLEEMKSQMEQKLFLLETEIYAIRCYLGEVVNFIHLRKGKNADIEQPLVMLQKVRYLDEEMGKLDALYDFSVDDLKYFEQVIQKDDNVLNNFLPTQKCVCLVRLSKTSIRLSASDTFANVLDAYRDEHGKKIGILIRDGENVYMTWTDEEKISVNEDMFYRPSIKTYSTEDEYLAQKAQSSKEEIASRYFLFNILLGISSGEYSEPLLTIHPKANLYVPSEYVIYSTADAWIEDNRYGVLSDLLDRINQYTLVGDNILTVKGLRPEGYNNSLRTGTWENYRGVGDRNITHDVSARDGAIYKINRIDYADSVLEVVTDKTKTVRNTKWVAGKLKDEEREEVLEISFYYNNSSTDAEMEKRLADWLERNGLTEENIIKKDLRKNKCTYISLAKSNMDYVYNGGRYTERQRESRANFLVHDYEYMNVELLNSEWLKYFLTTRKIGSSFGGNRYADFNYVVYYLNKSLKTVVEREKQEYELISQHIDLTKYPEWMVTLSEWKIYTGHHIIGPRYAKQFANTLKQLEE